MTSGTPNPSPTSRRPPKVSDTARPRSLTPSTRPHRQSPVPITRRDAPAAAVDGRLEQSRVVVVVSEQHRLAGVAVGHHGLRAGDDERRRVPQRQHRRRGVVAARQLDQPLVDRHQLGHVLAERRLGRRPGRAGPSPSWASHQRRYSGQVSSNSAFHRAPGRSSSTPMNRSVRVCGRGAGEASSQCRHCFGIHCRQS